MFPESRDQKLKYNVDCPLLMSEYIRGVTIRGFSVSVIFINNSRKLCSLFCENTKVSHKRRGQSETPRAHEERCYNPL